VGARGRPHAAGDLLAAAAREAVRRPPRAGGARWSGQRAGKEAPRRRGAFPSGARTAPLVNRRHWPAAPGGVPRRRAPQWRARGRPRGAGGGRRRLGAAGTLGGRAGGRTTAATSGDSEGAGGRTTAALRWALGAQRLAERRAGGSRRHVPCAGSPQQAWGASSGSAPPKARHCRPRPGPPPCPESPSDGARGPPAKSRRAPGAERRPQPRPETSGPAAGAGRLAARSQRAASGGSEGKASRCARRQPRRPRRRVQAGRPPGPTRPPARRGWPRPASSRARRACRAARPERKRGQQQGGGATESQRQGLPRLAGRRRNSSCGAFLQQPVERAERVGSTAIAVSTGGEGRKAPAECGGARATQTRSARQLTRRRGSARASSGRAVQQGRHRGDGRAARGPGKGAGPPAGRPAAACRSKAAKRRLGAGRGTRAAQTAAETAVAGQGRRKQPGVPSAPLGQGEETTRDESGRSETGSGGEAKVRAAETPCGRADAETGKGRGGDPEKKPEYGVSDQDARPGPGHNEARRLALAARCQRSDSKANTARGWVRGPGAAIRSRGEGQRPGSGEPRELPPPQKGGVEAVLLGRAAAWARPGPPSATQPQPPSPGGGQRKEPRDQPRRAVSAGEPTAHPDLETAGTTSGHRPPGGAVRRKPGLQPPAGGRRRRNEHTTGSGCGGKRPVHAQYARRSTGGPGPAAERSSKAEDAPAAGSPPLPTTGRKKRRRRRRGTPRPRPKQAHSRGRAARRPGVRGGPSESRRAGSHGLARTQGLQNGRSANSHVRRVHREASSAGAAARARNAPHPHCAATGTTGLGAMGNTPGHVAGGPSRGGDRCRRSQPPSPAVATARPWPPPGKAQHHGPASGSDAASTSSRCATRRRRSPAIPAQGDHGRPTPGEGRRSPESHKATAARPRARRDRAGRPVRAPPAGAQRGARGRCRRRSGSGRSKRELGVGACMRRSPGHPTARPEGSSKKGGPAEAPTAATG